MTAIETVANDMYEAAREDDAMHLLMVAGYGRADRADFLVRVRGLARGLARQIAWVPCEAAHRGGRVRH